MKNTEGTIGVCEKKVLNCLSPPPKKKPFKLSVLENTPPFSSHKHIEGGKKLRFPNFFPPRSYF